MTKFFFVILFAFICSARTGLAKDMATAPLPQFGDPALLIDNAKWIEAEQNFQAPGSETRTYLNLVTILYDWDNQRPWGNNYVSEANLRLQAFRTAACADLKAAISICRRPEAIRNGDDVATAEHDLQAQETISALKKRWNLTISTWPIAGHELLFSMVAASTSHEQISTAQYWNFQPEEQSTRILEDVILPDAANYLAGFAEKSAPTSLVTDTHGFSIDDRQLRQHAVDFAAAWKHAIVSNRYHAPANPIVDATEIQFQNLFDRQADQFANLYPQLLKKVEDLPDIRRRFESERTVSDYPEEIYQHVSYQLLSELVRVQGSYFALASHQRKGVSPRQQSLESLLTLQRYSSVPQVFAMELSTLMQPFSSHAYVLDQYADLNLVTTYVLENLKAILGLEPYRDKGIFPSGAKGWSHPALFDYPDFSADAPEVSEALNGKKLAELPESAQLQILKMYLEPAPGKIRAQAVFRMGALFLQSATPEELHQLAELIERQHFHEIEPVTLRRSDSDVRSVRGFSQAR